MASNTESGHNNRPPYFNGTKYSVWENKMKTFILRIDQDIWDIVEHGIILKVSTETKSPETSRGQNETSSAKGILTPKFFLII